MPNIVVINYTEYCLQLFRLFIKEVPFISDNTIYCGYFIVNLQRNCPL